MGEGDEKVIGEMGAPMFAGKSRPLGFLDLHLREEETSAAEFIAFVAEGWPASVEPPVPQGEDKHVGQPKFTAGQEKR